MADNVALQNARLDTLLQELKAGDHRVLVCLQITRTTGLLMEEFTQVYPVGWLVEVEGPKGPGELDSFPVTQATALPCAGRATGSSTRSMWAWQPHEIYLRYE